MEDDHKPFAGKRGKTIKESIPFWPAAPSAPVGAPNVLIVLFDDVGFSDFACYGSAIATPTIDALAARGLRCTGFHTTAMCSTTRAALLTGRNHHSVGMGCLANFDSGYPGYRGKIAREAGTLAEMLRPHGYRNYMVGKWHVTPLPETGPTGPFDGWPLGRGFDRYYGFMDAETDQYSPELVVDNTHIDAPGTYQTGYHLTCDLIDQSIRFVADHVASTPAAPWLLWVALGACHAPHQAPRELILKYDAQFQHGWDEERERRLARQLAMGIVPHLTQMPPRNDGVAPWDSLSADERKVFCRLQGAYAAMLDHADQNIARLIGFLERAGIADDTLVLVLSDNGASQEGFLWGMVNAMGPYNAIPEPVPVKLARLDEIGGPKSHSNFPIGWAMASNTPLKRYKQNTHGGGIRDPLVVSWPNGLTARDELRHQFCYAADLVPTLLEVIGIKAPEAINGVAQMAIEGSSFAACLHDKAAGPRRRPQYFEMFGHRGLWQDGWKAVAYHPSGTPFENDRWELYHLDKDFSETTDLAAQEPARLKAMIETWWREAERCDVLPLDDRFAQRFAENAARVQGGRRRFVFHAGMGHVPTDVAPDVRSRSYTIEAEVEITCPTAEGVLIAHGDATSGYSLYVKDGLLVHDLNIGGSHQIVRSVRRVPLGPCRLGFCMRRLEQVGTGTLFIDREPAGEMTTRDMFRVLISWSGLDIGRDRGSTVSHYASPFAFTGKLSKVTITIGDDQALDSEGAGRAEMGRQ
jgi:arylsulfatase A-like enzyme